ncbi:MAG: DoxX family membrane protein [Bacteroidetes bacterium]|nr:DoxX family membrane protein [Bacteroidota bacterium]
MRALIYFSRIFVGGLFIVSGIIKANDPLGFSYKLQEYFAESALNLPFLEPYALALAILACLAEIVLGFAVIFGAKMPLATWSLLLLTVFFGWLTFYTATCDESATYTILVDGIMEERPVTCVTDCGCFGDAMKGSLGRSLTPWESFYKDLILFIFIVPLFFKRNSIALNSSSQDAPLLGGALVIISLLSWVFGWGFPIVFAFIGFLGYLLMKRLREKPSWAVAGYITLMSLVFVYYGVEHLPMKDYRPYAVGKSIPEQMKSAEELGLEAPVYIYNYSLENETTGERVTVTSKEYLDDKWWEKKEWKQDKEATTGPFKISDGYEPTIPDFSVLDMEGSEINYEIFESEVPVLLVITYDVERASNNMDKISKLAAEAQAQGWNVYGMTSSLESAIDEFRHTYQLAFPYTYGDEKVLKTVVRSNPGVVLINQGTIMAKYSANDIPMFQDLQSKLNP